MGEEPPSRDDLLLDPDAWRSRLARLPRVAVSDAETEQRFPLAPPDHVDRDLKRLRQIVATPPPTTILCDNEGQLERLEELLGVDRATLAVGALDGGFIMPTLRILTDHEIFRRARRLRRPRRYRSAVSTAASRPLTPGLSILNRQPGGQLRANTGATSGCASMRSSVSWNAGRWRCRCWLINVCSSWRTTGTR